MPSNLVRLRPHPQPFWSRGMIIFILIAVALAVLAPVLALAQDLPAPPADDLGQLVSVFVQAFTLSGTARWFALLFCGVLLAVALIRRLFKDSSTRVGKFIRSDEGGSIVNLLVSAVGTLLAKVLVGAAISWPVAGAAFLAAAGGTAGLWSHGRRVLRLLVPLVAKIPKVGALLAKLLDLLSGASTKAEIQKLTDARYQPAPATSADQAADQLGKAPVP